MICRSFPVCSTQMERKKAGMKCVIFAGLPAAPELHSWWADADYVIAADAGYENACRVGVEPDLLLGDYDSAPRPEAGAKTVFLPAEKDDTDTYYAARKALELGATDVVIVGGLGGARLDHTLANLQTLFQAGAHLWIRIPVIPGVNDQPETMQQMKDWLDQNGTPEKIELLPYHAMGENKYRALGKQPPVFSVPDAETMTLLRSIFT